MLNGKIKLETFVFLEAKYGPLKAIINEAYGIWDIARGFLLEHRIVVLNIYSVFVVSCDAIAGHLVAVKDEIAGRVIIFPRYGRFRSTGQWQAVIDHNGTFFTFAEPNYSRWEC